MKDKLKPAVGYIRMSTDQQQDSPARQRRDINALADRLGYRIIDWYEDHGLTGTESLNRPKFQRLLLAAKDGKFEAVLLSEQSRMSREDIFDAMLHWRLLRDAGVKIVTCQRGELDFSNLGGVITAIVDQYGAHEESVKLADRVISGKRLAVSNGHRQGGALYGYDREILDETGQVIRRVSFREKFRKAPTWSSRLVVSTDEQAVEAVRYMIDAVGNGMNYGTVARDLNRRGIRTTFGKRFNGSSIRRIVTNPAYAGDIVYGQTRRRGKFRTLFDEGGVVYQDGHEALVGRKAFDRAQRASKARYQAPKAASPGRYLLTGLVYLADTGRRLHGYISRYRGMKTPRRYYALAPRYFEEYPEESGRPSFRADTIENAVLTKLRDYMSDERNKRSMQGEIAKRTRKAQANIASLEKRLGDVRAKIERGIENLALANREDVPGVSRLLGQWRDEEARLKEKLAQANGCGTPSPEAMQIMAKMDQLLKRLSEANREKLAFALRQTVKRITLRRERLGDGRHAVTLWDGVIELRDDLGLKGTISLTDDDIPSPGRWHDVVAFIRKRGDVVFFRDVCEHLHRRGSFVSRLLAQAVLSGKVRNLGHQKGWMAVE